MVKGEGEDFRGRGRWGRQGEHAGSLLKCQSVYSGALEKGLNAAASPQSVQPWGNGFKLRRSSFIYIAVWIKIS